MAKSLMIILFFAILIGYLYSEEIDSYDFIYMKTIVVGKNEGQIGWQVPYAGGFSGPSTFCISQDRKFYVPDRVNYRINVYDFNFNFIKTIIEDKKESHFALSMKIDENENLISLLIGKGLKKINQSGVTIFYIKWNYLPDNIQGRYNYFPINDEVFFYNDQGKVEYITPDGEIIKDDRLTTKIEELSLKRKNEKKESGNGIRLPADKIKIIDELRNDPSLLLINDEFCSTSFDDTKKYFEKIQAVREYVISEKRKNKDKYKVQNININLDAYSLHLIDYDKNHNSYWTGIIDRRNGNDTAIIIFSKYGELLDAFYYEQYRKTDGFLAPDFTNYPTSGAEVAVAPNGDIYFLRAPVVTLSKVTVENPVPQVLSGEMVYTFYRIRNVWDPIDSTTSSLPKATILNASSFIDYKNMYTPKMLFDGKPETAWLEGKKDAGIGESVTLTLDKEITVDKLQIASGYFDPRWWKANNRLKKLLIELDSYKKEAVFKDEITMQDIVLDKSISFKKAKFTILEVYPSGKDNDTAISEIVFYNSGKKVELDVSGIK